MTRLYDDPHTFTEDMIEGFLDVNRDSVIGVPGGIVRAVETLPGKVAVVVGGGSGHYRAFCGLVGQGFADGAVVGNGFKVLSEQDAYSVARAASGGGGLVLITGNYAGDVMSFTLAQERLVKEGVDTRVVLVTDDIASAPASKPARRRGVAGDFVVFKVAGAATEGGYDLDAVERVARLANDRTRTLGLAFGGDTRPGVDAPLSVPGPVAAGQLRVRLGFHAEPVLAQDMLPRAAELAARLVSGVLSEKPAGSGNRVATILNGLGVTMYEELFLVWRSVAKLLAERGLEVVEPEVGEVLTSLDLAGCSLTVVFLDDELERLWRAPTDTPAYSKGRTASTGSTGRPGATNYATSKPLPGRGAAAAQIMTPDPRPGSPASRACGRTIVSALEAMDEALSKTETERGCLDAVVRGDHGRGMVAGVCAGVIAARAAVESGGGAQSVLAAAGKAWAVKAGGISGVLWGAALRKIGESLGDDGGVTSGADIAEAMRAGLKAIQRLGEARLGDRTMVDAFAPFVETLGERVASGVGWQAAWLDAAEVSEDAAQATAWLRPRISLVRPLADPSIGTPDAGAISFAICVRAVAGVLAAAEVAPPGRRLGQV